MSSPTLKLFVNYRRDDEAIFVELLRTHFMFRYSRDNVFMDFDSIPPFARFEDFIKQKVQECDLVVAIIGPRWLELLQEKEAQGKTDFVRLELLEALRLGKIIAPVCIQGAKIPFDDQIPTELLPIFKVNIPTIGQGRDLLNNIEWLMQHMERELTEGGIHREAANSVQQSTFQAAIEENPDIDELLKQFFQAFQQQDYPQALIWLTQIRTADTVPEFFKLEQREATIQQLLKETEDRRRRREVVEYLYKFVRQMSRFNEPVAEIRSALDEIWKIEPGYNPDLLATLEPATTTIYPTRSTVYDLLPDPFEWIEIPAGRVTVRGKDEHLAIFHIAKYPVTNAQYVRFIEAGGYKQPDWWTNDGWEIREKEKWTNPRYWQDEKWNELDYPVVGITWHEAIAFCLWLSDASGENICLPTEQQWQRAAQSDDGRIYPWGNDWDNNRCNNSVSGSKGNSTTAVTDYAGWDKGNSFFDLVDMAGNVWEWCVTDYITGNNDMNKNADSRVLRGGSWWNNHIEKFRVDFRAGDNPDYRYVSRGFRFVRV